MKKLTILMAFLLFFAKSTNIYAYTVSSFDHVYDWSIYSNQSGTYYYDKNLTLDNINVRVLQNDTHYTFYVTAEANQDPSLRNVIGYTSKGRGTAIQGYGEYYGWLGRFPAGPDQVMPNSINETHTLAKKKMHPFLYSQENFTNNRIEQTDIFNISNGGDVYKIDECLRIGNNIVSRFYYNKYYENHSYGNYEYYETQNYHYIPFSIKEIYDCYGVPDMLYNPYSGQRDIKQITNDNLKTHSGLEMISNTCSVKDFTLDGANRVATLTYDLSAEFKIQKDLIEKYRYLAFGGLNYILSFQYLNDYISRYTGIFSTTDTIDLMEYANCEHEWIYEIDEVTGEHKKTCSKCEWCINGAHDFCLTYDGIENNRCECGINKKVRRNYIIDDDYIASISYIKEVNVPCEIHTYQGKEGYEFLYYEEIEKQIDGSDIVRNVATMSDMTTNLSITYKAIYTPIVFMVNYDTQIGHFSNGMKYISKQYEYINFDNFEKVYEIPSDGTYFSCWIYDNEKIYKTNEIKRYIATQNETIDLSAYFGKYESRKEEISDDGLIPSAGGGLINKTKYKKKKEDEKIEETKLNNIEKEEKTKKDVEIYDMTNSQINIIKNLFKIKKASLSEINGKYKYYIYGNKMFIKLMLYIIENKKIIIFSLFIILILLICDIIKEKRKKRKK